MSLCTITVHNEQDMTKLATDKILDRLSSCILCVDQNLSLTYLNSSAEMLFDNSASSLLGKDFRQLFSRVEANTITDKLPRLASQGQAMTEHDATIRLANGRSISADYTIYALDDTDGSNNILIEIKPLDHQAQYLRDEVSHLQKQASQSVARGIAHEIRNPLGGIRGAAQLLEREIKQPSLKEYTDVIISEVDRLQTLISNMLGPNTKITRKPVNILEILEHIRGLLLTAEPGQFVIQRDYDPSIPEIRADKDQLIQAFLNIAQNAVQALGTNGEITFKTRIGRQFTIGQVKYPLVIQVDIIDNGRGISSALSDTIFLPMVTDKPQGSGLGLPIAQEIVSAHGGIISAESSASRTTFSTILPLEI